MNKINSRQRNDWHVKEQLPSTLNLIISNDDESSSFSTPPTSIPTSPEIFARINPDIERNSLKKYGKGSSSNGKGKEKSLEGKVKIIRKRSKGTLSAAKESNLIEIEQLPPGYESIPHSPILPRTFFPLQILSSDDDEQIWSSLRFDRLGTRNDIMEEEEGPIFTRTYSTTTTQTFKTYSTKNPYQNDYEFSYDSESEGGGQFGGGKAYERKRAKSHNPTTKSSSSTKTLRSTSSFQSIPIESNSRESNSTSGGVRVSGLKNEAEYKKKFDKMFQPPPYQTTKTNYQNPTNYDVPPPKPKFTNVFNSVFLLVFSAVAAWSISAILLTSFSLTAYDDLNKRFALLSGIKFDKLLTQFGERMEVVKTGVSKILGGTKRGFGVVPWGKSSKFNSTSRKSCRDSHFFTTASSTPIVPLEQLWNSDNDDEEEESFSILRNSTTTFGNELISDEEIELKEEEIEINKGLPPRPPLLILIPSIITLIFLTIFKILRNSWTSKSTFPT